MIYGIELKPRGKRHFDWNIWFLSFDNRDSLFKIRKLDEVREQFTYPVPEDNVSVEGLTDIFWHELNKTFFVGEMTEEGKEDADEELKKFAKRIINLMEQQNDN